MSLPAISFGDRVCVSRKGGTGRGGWVHLKGASSMAVSGANSMSISGLSFRNTLVGIGWAVSLRLCMNRLRKQSFHLLGPSFPTVNTNPNIWINLAPKILVWERYIWTLIMIRTNKGCKASFPSSNDKVEFRGGIYSDVLIGLFWLVCSVQMQVSVSVTLLECWKDPMRACMERYILFEFERVAITRIVAALLLLLLSVWGHCHSWGVTAIIYVLEPTLEHGGVATR